MEKTKRKDMIAGWILFVLLMFLSAFGMSFHEPWFDEIQAYLIARDASLHDILFVLPHYEGHPPLWHLLLMIPARLGLGCKTSLAIVQLITFAGFAAMLELRSPFGAKMKIFLSMSYFILYQYSVISRSYAMLMLAALLAADLYPDKEKKPFRYLLSMIFLCLCHSYGIAIAGGLAVADLLRRLIKEKSLSGLFRNTEKKLIVAYCVLLAAALVIIAEIFPAGNARGTDYAGLSSFISSFFLCWALLPAETVFTTFINDDTWLQRVHPGISEILAGFVLSAVIWYILIRICKRRKLLGELLFPFVFLYFFMAVYSLPHHFGIFIALSLMILWISQKTARITVAEVIEPLERSESLKKVSKYIVGCFICAASVINLYWSVNCFIVDWKSVYDTGEKTAQWLKDNDLDDKKIVAGWDSDTSRILTYGSVSANGFADHNLFINADQGLSYCTHVMTTDEEYAEDIERIKAMGSPEVILSSSVSIADEIEELDLKDKYILCYLRKGERVFKDQIITVHTVIYVRSDLADKVEKYIE